MFSRNIWEKLVWISFCLLAILFSLKHLTIGEDASLYLSTGKNFLETGQFFYFVNWPDKTIRIQTQPYLDYPPGMPLFLAILYLFTDDSFLVAVWAQVFFVLALYTAFFFFLRRLRTPFLLQILMLVILTFQETFLLLYSLFVSELFFLSLMLGCGYYALQIHQEENEGRAWRVSYLLLFCASSLKFVGVFNLAWFLIPILSQFRKRFKYGCKAVIVAFLPFLLWTLRHRLFFSGFRSSHEFSVDFERILVPFSFFYRALWQFYGISSTFALLLLILVVFSPFYLYKKWNAYCTLQTIILVAFGTHFLGTLTLSLFIVFDPLENRLLSPSIVAGLLAIIFGLQTIFEQRNTFYFRTGIVLLSFLFLFLNHAVSKTMDIAGFPTLISCEEKQLAKEMALFPALQKSSHFYSDYNFRLQLLFSKPQNILWFPASLWKPDIFQELIQMGKTPFFLLQSGSAHQKIVEIYFQKNSLFLQKIELLKGCYMIYLVK